MDIASVGCGIFSYNLSAAGLTNSSCLAGAAGFEFVNGSIAYAHMLVEFNYGYTSGMGWLRPQYPGVLTTARSLLFTADPAGNFIAFDAKTGKILWHAPTGAITNGPQTYILDGKQYVLAASGDTLYAFYLQ
jgi:alcohol dehydrogenase (cytochrome c)